MIVKHLTMFKYIFKINYLDCTLRVLMDQKIRRSRQHFEGYWGSRYAYKGLFLSYPQRAPNPCTSEVCSRPNIPPPYDSSEAGSDFGSGLPT